MECPQNYFLQLPPTETLPSLHSVSIASAGFFAGSVDLLAGRAEDAVAGIAVPGATLCWVYMIFLAPLAQVPTTFPGALAAVSTTTTLKLATPAALILPSICSRSASQLSA